MTIPPNPHPEQVEAIADALDCFWNAALTDTHAYGDPTANAVMAGVVSGVAAVANHLREIASLAKRPADDGEPRAWMRRWFFDRNEGSKGNRPRGWTLHECTPAKLLPDDVPLYAPPLQPEGVKR